MEFNAEKFVDRLLSKEAEEQPIDDVKPEHLEMELPKDFDEEKFDKGRAFFSEYCFALTSSMLLGLVAVFAIPSILNILVGSRRSSSVYTAYRRYLSTTLHTVSWFDHPLKPGSLSWKSLYTVRTRHLQAAMAGKLKGIGQVSQRDVAITQFGFVGYSILKPDKLGIRQLKKGDWEAYNYTWRTIGYMLGLDDRYNICRPNVGETREVLQVLLERVFTPCMENAPEYFEHMSRVMLDGMWYINPTIDVEGFLYSIRALTDVPGYIYTEEDRIKLQLKLKKCLKGKPIETGVDSRELIRPAELEGLPDRAPRLLYYKDYDSMETVPTYKPLTLNTKFKLYLYYLYVALHTSFIGRWYFNLNFRFSMFLMQYFPYLAFFKFGIKRSLANIFEDDPTDDTKPKPNAEYYKPKEPESWFKTLLSWLW